jgi:hypothetical protein
MLRDQCPLEELTIRCLDDFFAEHSGVEEDDTRGVPGSFVHSSEESPEGFPFTAPLSPLFDDQGMGNPNFQPHQQYSYHLEEQPQHHHAYGNEQDSRLMATNDPDFISPQPNSSSLFQDPNQYSSHEYRGPMDGLGSYDRDRYNKPSRSFGGEDPRADVDPSYAQFQPHDTEASRVYHDPSFHCDDIETSRSDARERYDLPASQFHPSECGVQNNPRSGSRW